MLFFEFFMDPVLRGPFWASIFIAMSCSVIGTLALMRKEALIGETLSHSAYPGVILGVIVAASIEAKSEFFISLIFLLFGSLFAFLGYRCIVYLKTKQKLSSDVAQCYCLASFLAFGVMLASLIQKSHSLWYRKIKSLLFGQAATLDDFHIVFFGCFFLGLLAFVLSSLWLFKATTFDREYCQVRGVKLVLFETLLTTFFSLIVILGMRCVGSILMCGMLVAPAICSRYLCRSFFSTFLLATLVGAFSAGLGVYLSMSLSESFGLQGLATGPLIVILASCCCFLSFIFSWKNGVFFKAIRKLRFQTKSASLHILKALWKHRSTGLKDHEITGVSSSLLIKKISLRSLWSSGLIYKDAAGGYFLTRTGSKKAAYIVRVHRLWELYLSKHYDLSDKSLHESAEEMEHVIDSDMETKLTKLLNNPKKDPHNQPIPTEESYL